jgi:hypothetical protein
LSHNSLEDLGRLIILGLADKCDDFRFVLLHLLLELVGLIINLDTAVDELSAVRNISSVFYFRVFSINSSV